MRALVSFVFAFTVLACDDEECSADSQRCTREGVEQCVTTQCSLVSMHTSWTLVQRCASDEMCTFDGCASPDGGTRAFDTILGEDCSVH
jgi:hypothetical protein